MSNKYETEEVRNLAKVLRTDLSMAYNILILDERVGIADKNGLKEDGLFGSPAAQVNTELDE